MTDQVETPLTSRDRWLDLGWAAFLSLLVTGPLLLSTGFWLAGDMVFVPRQPWKPEWLGLDGSLPRAVPGDAVISLLTMVVPGWLVQRLFLIGGLLLAALGAARMVGGRPWYARWAAMSLWIFNPWVYDRLLIGQWAILLGCLMLPWVVLATRQNSRIRWAWLYLALLACAVASPAPGLIAALVALALMARDGWRSLAWASLLAAIANAVWIVPALVATAQVPADGAGFAGFAPQAESAAGLIPTLLSAGGIWKTAIVAGERQVPAVVWLTACVSVGAFVMTIRSTRSTRSIGRRTGGERSDRAGGSEVAVLIALGVISLAYVALTATKIGQDLLAQAGEYPLLAPGLNMFRDSHRLLVLWLLVLIPGAAYAAQLMAQAIRPGREALALVVAGLVALPIVALPSLLWGGGGRLQTAHYPTEWHEVAALVADTPGAMVVLPWHGAYRGFTWNHRTAVLDPAPRFFAPEVLVDDRVFLGAAGSISAEDPRRAGITAALALQNPSDQAQALAAQGIRWILVEKGMVELTPPLGELRRRGDSLDLVELAPTPTSRIGLPSNSVRILFASYITSLMCLLLSLGWLVVRFTSRKVDRPRTIVRTVVNRRKDAL